VGSADKTGPELEVETEENDGPSIPTAMNNVSLSTLVRQGHAVGGTVHVVHAEHEGMIT
jgi:hypothetical protein